MHEAIAGKSCFYIALETGDNEQVRLKKQQQCQDIGGGEYHGTNWAK
jgi:hypothetical protein